MLATRETYLISLSQTHIDELLQVLVKACQIILFLLVVGNQALFLFQQPLSGLFQLFSLGVLVIDAGDHQVMLIIFRTFWFNV